MRILRWAQKIIVVSVGLGLSYGAGATVPNPIFTRPHFFSPGIYGPDFSYSDSHGGYGFISSYEIFSDSEFNFSCSQEKISSYASSSSTPPTPTAELNAWIQLKIAPTALQELQKRVFEFLVYEAGALNASVRPVGLSLPTQGCVPATSSGAVMEALLPKGFPTDDEVKIAEMPLRLRLMKFRGVWSQTRPSSLIYALAFHDLLLAQQKMFCGSPTTESTCFDLQYEQKKLEGSFTLLFSQAEPDELDTLRKALIRFLGAERANQIAQQSAGAPADYSETNIVQLGQMDYDSLRNAPRDTLLFQAYLDRAFEHATKFGAPAELQQSLITLINIGKGFLIKVKLQLQDEANQICSLDLQTILQKYPNVVRQTLTDDDATTKSDIRAALCQTPNLQSLQSQISCAGISGGPLPGPTPIQIQRRSSEFPLSSVNAFSISQPTVQDPIEFTLHIPLKFDADLTDDVKSATLQKWANSATNWYNCQVGQSGASTFSYMQVLGDPAPTDQPTVIQCPAALAMTNVPRIKFSINFDASPTDSTDTTAIKVHRCYRAEISSSDCAAVQSYALNSCLQSCRADVKCAQDCSMLYGTVGDPHNNRADSGNYIVAQYLGTLFHELGHKFGLHDEYSDQELPLTPIGRASSIMKDSHQHDPRLNGLQILKMLEPLGCMKR